MDLGLVIVDIDNLSEFLVLHLVEQAILYGEMVNHHPVAAGSKLLTAIK